MRMFALWVIMCTSAVVARAADEIVIRPLGDETRLTQVKASPAEFFRKPFILTGAATVSDYYNFGYDNAEFTHFSFEFREIINEQKRGENIVGGQRCHLYLLREGNKQIANQIIDAAPKYRAMRGRVAIARLDSTGKPQWDQLELLDVAFLKPDGTWGDWMIRAAEDARRKEEEKTKTEEAQRRKADEDAAKKRKAQEEAARWRVWTIKGEPVEARFSGMASGKTLLKKRDGTKISVSTKDLGPADRKWIEERTKAKR